MKVGEHKPEEKAEEGDAKGDYGDEDNTEDVPLNPDAETGTVVNTSPIPQDRGWAWVILGGCVYSIFIFGGIMRSFGVFFLEYQKRFNSSASETATMSMIQNIVVSVSGLFIMTVGLKKFSCRTTVMVGGLCVFVSYVVTALSSSITVFYLVQGILGGFGICCIHPPLLVMLSVYFSKHKGLANSIFTAGGSMGGLVFAPIVIKLFEEFGYTGALLIVAALMSNIFVSGCLMRPPEFYTKRTKKDKQGVRDTTTDTSPDVKPINGRLINNTINSNDSLNKSSELTKNKNDIHKPDSKQIDGMSNVYVTKKPRFEMQRMVSHDPRVGGTGCESPVLQRIRANSVDNRRKRTISEDEIMSRKPMNGGSLAKSTKVLSSGSGSLVSLAMNGATVCGSFIDVNNSSVTPDKDNDTQSDNGNKTQEKLTILQRVREGTKDVLLTIFDLSLLRNAVFLYFLVLAFCGVSSVGLVPVFIPTYANEIGVSNEKIGLLVSILAAIDFFAKLTTGVITDRKWIKRNNLLAIVFFTIGTACHFIRFIKSFETMIIFVVIAGLCCGQYISTFAVLLSEIIGPERFKQSLGFTTLTHGISIAIFFPIAGKLKDDTKSYVNSLHLLGGLSYVACLCALTIPLVRRWAARQQHTHQGPRL